MKKTITQRFFLSLCLMIVGCLWGSSAWAETVTYQHVFNAKPSTGNSVTLTGVAWNISATNLNNYNKDYAGVQIGASGKDGQITLTSSSDWNYNGKTKITAVRLWLNRGGTSVTPTITIGGKSATSDGKVVAKKSSAGTDWTKATKVTFTPAADGNTGVIVIDVKSVKAGYICALEIDCEEAPTLSSVAVSGTPTKTTYEAGDAFKPAGLVVTGTYSDGSPKTITEGITWNFDPATLTEGLTSVNVTAKVDGITSDPYKVDGLIVTAARTLSSVTLEGNPTKTTYIVGETFDPTGIKVMANYTTGDPKDVTSEAIFNFDNSALTLSTTSMAVTATYGGMTSAEQNYTITVLKTIVPFAPKVIYRKITSTADIVDGGVYLIVCEARNEAMGSLNSSSSRGEGEPITISGNTYTGKVNQSGYPYEITISQAKNGNYNLYHASGYFINGKNGNELAFSTTTGDDGWSVIFDEDGNVEISNSKKEGNYIQRYKTSNYYKNYSSSSGGQTPVQLYQKFGEMSIAQVTGGITTYVADFAYSMPQHLVGHTVTQADKAGVITTHKAFRAGEEVPALTPLLIKSTEDYEETSKTYYPAVLNKSVAAYEGDNMLEYNRDAYGLTKTTNSESVYYYKLAIKDGNVGFYWGADEGAAFQMTKPSTAYLTVPQTMSVQGFVLNLEEGETTGIATVTTDENVPIYNLQGIRMNGKNLPKGIYIQGGKKFMVK